MNFKGIKKGKTNKTAYILRKHNVKKKCGA